MNKRILVGMSGGSDSDHTAKYLLEKGYEVVGVNFIFCGKENSSAAAESAAKLGIEFYEIDKRSSFEEKVIIPFIEEYAAGRTPNPCAVCNPKMKFASLIEAADEFGCEKIATGHYAKIAENNGRYCLYKALDEDKDQTYFLWGLSQNILARTIFPMSDFIKKDIKNAGKKESMDICFIPSGDTHGFVSERIKNDIYGNFIDVKGNILGKHRGISNYTIGQRRGLGIALGERAFITDIDAESGNITLGFGEDMKIDKIIMENINYVSCDPASIPAEGLFYKSRSRMKPEPCRVVFDSEKRAAVIPRFSAKRVAAGQSICIYDDEKLLFGGIAVKN